MTRRDVKRLLLALGGMLVVTGVLVALLVRPTYYGPTLWERLFAKADEYGREPTMMDVEPQLLVSVIVLLVVGVGLLIFGAALTADSQGAPQVPPHGWQPPAWQAPPQQPWQGQSQAQHAPPTWQQPQQPQPPWTQQPPQPPRDPWRPPPPPPA